MIFKIAAIIAMAVISSSASASSVCVKMGNQIAPFALSMHPTAVRNPCKSGDTLYFRYPPGDTIELTQIAFNCDMSKPVFVPLGFFREAICIYDGTKEEP